MPTPLRHSAFRKLWSATTLAALGDAISSVALPLAAITVLGADAVQSAVLSAVIWLPSLFLAIPAGSFADRTGYHRRLMAGANLLRVAALSSAPIATALGVLSLAQLAVILAVIGLCSVLSNVSESGLFATTLPSELYVAGQAASYTGQTAALLAGPAVGGLLVQLAGVPAAIGVDAATAVAAALFLLRLRPVERLQEPSAPQSRDRRPGLAFIRRNPLIRTALAVTATGNFFNMLFLSVLVWYYVHKLSLTSAEIGFVFTAQAIGGLVGAAVAPRLARRIGLGRMLLIGCVLSHAPLLVIPAVGTTGGLVFALVVASTLLGGGGESVQDISVGSVFALVVPPHLRSQTRGAYQTVSFGLRPLGSVVGALIAATAGIPAALWIGAVGGTLACLWLLPARLLSFRGQGDPSEELESATLLPQ
ncbi:MFS transporter [Streptomyces gilvus]|uniref:MFS transporter n=1 Tax=Streptomyces gilvus TaxID=2920937 RepID=UPI001F0EDD0C|nr:MFS transporter [Streptomyces sp. CME 23]MCH5674432.1 MFS transporter [Streptomyces sp. CME 23]